MWSSNIIEISAISIHYTSFTKEVQWTETALVPMMVQWLKRGVNVASEIRNFWKRMRYLYFHWILFNAHIHNGFTLFIKSGSISVYVFWTWLHGITNSFTGSIHGMWNNISVNQTCYSMIMASWQPIYTCITL